MYDLGDGKVLKKRNSKIIAYAVMLRSTLPYSQLWMFPKYYKSGTNEALSSIQKISSSDLDIVHFANPRILEDGITYMQDKVIPLDSYLKNNSLEKGYKTIDKFIDFSKFLLLHSLIDKSFNIGKNFGVNAEGEIVMSDIGEIWSNPESIQKQIKNKVWTYGYVLEGIPHKELQTYFIERMNNNFLVEL